MEQIRALTIVYPVSWVPTGGMMIFYYFGQRGKLFGKDLEGSVLIGQDDRSTERKGDIRL